MLNWILTKEKLPENNKLILLNINSSYIRLGFYSIKYNKFFIKEDSIHVINNIENVISWAEFNEPKNFNKTNINIG